MSIFIKSPNIEKDKQDEQDGLHISVSAPGTLIGATVSAIVYTTLSTTGEIVAVATGTSIELSGNILAYGTELTFGSLPAETIRMAAKTYGALARPAISNSSRLGALGISVIAGTGAALTTSALIYGGKQTHAFLYSCIENYKQTIPLKIQYPIELDTTILIIDDDTLLIDDDTLLIND
jgi:hypothetical protein